MLVAHILNVFQQYGLTEEQVKEHVYFVSDRGSNIKSGLLNNGFRRITCYAHLIHNLVCAMLEDELVKTIVKQCSALSAYMKNTGLNRKLNTSLKIHVQTRWNSVYAMINAILENHKDIYDLLQEKQKALDEHNRKNNKKLEDILELLTIIDTDELKRIRDFLQPFKVKKNIFFQNIVSNFYFH